MTAKAADLSVEELESLVINALEDLKAKEIVCLDTAEISSVMSRVVIASGTSNRHAKAAANSVVMSAKEAGLQPLGVEGQANGEWVLIDLGDVVVHVMQQETREFYELEKLWSGLPEIDADDE
jgi:ribosome-associated protein